MATDYKQISELTEATTIANSDLFVIQQGTTAKKCTGTTFLAMVEAHGGISSITKTSTSGLVDTYTITFVDATTSTFTVTNGADGDDGDDGNGISSISKTGTSGLVDTYTISYTDGTSTTFTVTNGAKGDTGDEAEIIATEYGTSASSSTQPTTWTSTVPTVTGGNYLWTRYTWNTGDYTYMCTRYGVDGTGTGDMTKSVYSPNYTGELASNADLEEHTEDADIHCTASQKSTWNNKSTVSVSETGTATDEVNYITINGVEKKIGGAIEIDSTPTSGSTNAVQSGGTYTALQEVKTYAKTQDGRRTRTDITNNLTNLPTAIAEQNLEKYGYTIGDYFTGASGYTYYLADMDTAYGGYNSYGIVGTHHCGVVVDTHSTTTWLSSGSASSYSASTLHSFLTSTALPLIKSDITALFGSWSSHMLARNVLDNGVGGWGTTWTGLANCYLTAMSEVQMYGARVFGCDGNQTGTEAKPLELFMKYRWNEIYGNVSVWLKSLCSASAACGAGNYGIATNLGLSVSARASGLILLY